MRYWFMLLLCGCTEPGEMPRDLRCSRRSVSRMFRRLARARSENPCFFARVSNAAGGGFSRNARIASSRSTRDCSCSINQAFVPVNCGAIPAELMESEFFGHRKGSFTGAILDKEGLFQAANGGTLFLDEIGDMPAELQTRLLRVLADGEFYRVGGHSPASGEQLDGHDAF